MRGFDAKFLDELKNKTDIVSLIGRYVRLEQRGGNFWGKCPFHHEKTASFSVNAAGQFYYCFGCHKSGDAISFVMEIEALDFADAVKFLAERAKMTLPEVKYDDEKIKENKRRKERLLDLLKDAARFYAHNLYKPGAEKHIEYVNKRGISRENLMRFGIGASLNFSDLPSYLKGLGYTDEEQKASGAVGVKDGRIYDALGGRLIIPIINQFGQVVAFGGRLLEKADFAKYKNTGETEVFSKSNILFNINNLKKLKNEKGLDSVIIVEGYMDTISLAEGGFMNVVASMGTSLTKDQARIIKRYCDKVIISYDGDFAGQKASVRGLEILKDEGLEVKVVNLPDGIEPDNIIKKLGREGYEKCLLEAKPLIDFKLDILKKTYDLNSVDGKRKYVTAALKVIKESSSAAEQEDLLKTVRDATGVTFESLKRELFNLEDKGETQKSSPPAPTFTDNAGDKSQMAARFVLASYLFNKPFARETDISEVEFILPVHKRIKEYISEKNVSGGSVRFNDLYELFGEEYGDEIGRIAGLETEENKQFDQAKYFSDCVRILKAEKINEEINRLTAMFSSETDVGRRRELAREMSEKLAEKNRLLS